MSKVNYTVEEVTESVRDSFQPPNTITLTVKQGYKDLKHVNKVNTETFDNSRRDLFTASINSEHPNEELRGQNVYLKKITLNNKNQLQCWREMMIGLEIKHELTTNIVDNWIEIQDGRPVSAYYSTLDKGGISFKQALRTKGMLRREKGQKAPISFFQFAKIAQDLITTLIILKKNSVLHRDIIINNVLLYDLHGEDKENPGPRTEIIDFGWAKKIVNATATTNTGTAGKIAPEISLKTKEYTSLIASKAYSYPVDIFATGQLLAEIIEIDRGFLKTFNKILGFQQCGNSWIDESFGATMFALFAEKSDGSGSFSPMTTPTDKQKDAMINVNEGIRMPDPEPYKKRLKRFLDVNRKGQLVRSDSLSQKYLRNFWFRYLDPAKGWTPERIDMAVDLIMRMMNYWPDYRPTAEELYQHEIFQEKDSSTGQPILPERNDAEGIDNLVKLSNDENFRVFQGKLAESNSKLFMKTKSSMNHFEDSGDGPKTTIHEILTLEEKIELGNNVHLKVAAVIDKMAAAEDNGITLDNLKSFMQPGDQGDYIERTEEEKDDAENYDTAESMRKDAGAAWGSKVHTNDEGVHYQVFGNDKNKNYEDEGQDDTNYDESMYDDGNNN